MIQDLEKKVDSLAFAFKSDELLIDSLLKLDSINKVGVFQMIQLKQNERDYESVCRFSELYFQYDQFSLTNLIYGTSLEQLGFLDSAKNHYKYILENAPDSLWFGNYRKPELITVVYGIDSAFNYLKRIEPVSDLSYLSLSNAIRNYQGLGYREFFVFPFPELTPLKFYVVVPDSIFNSGEINSIRSLSLFFAKEGINVYPTGTDTANQGYFFSSQVEYKEMIEGFTLLKVIYADQKE